MQYDVFTSYNPADAAWVWDWLVPRLKQAGLQVAIDDESFQPGAPVLEEIERCIAASRKTIVVLSPAWVADQSKVFESLLVQHQDPGARLRQLIPLLLRPCTPPPRIQLLHWVDFTDARRQEEQIKRVVNAIAGAAELPELHPERALPDALQRTWELRWLWAVGLIAVVTLGLLGGWVWSQRPPSRMDAEKYGVAVAEFTVEDEKGGAVRSDLGAQMASRIAGFIAQQGGELAEVMQSPVQVWGDSPRIPAVAAGTAAARVEAIGADVLVYGAIRQAAQGLLASPVFYLNEAAVSNNASELVGEHALGTPIAFVSDDRASEGNLTATMRARTRALTQLLMGLSHYAAGTTDSYRHAAAIFQAAAQDPEWGAGDTPSGQEVLYLFLGNALLKLGSLATTAEERTQQLQASEEAYQRALFYNDQYPRVYNALGSLYFQQAQSSVTDDECLRWDWDVLEAAADAYTRALAMPDATKPPSGNVDLRANLGLGRIRYYQGLCLSTDIEPAAWQAARQHHQAVLDAYTAVPLPLLQFVAVLALLDLGDMALYEADWRLAEDTADPKAPDLLAEAEERYRQALTLSPAPMTEESLRLALLAQGQLLVALCAQDRPAQAADSLEDFLAAHVLAAELAQTLQAILSESCSNEA